METIPDYIPPVGIKQFKCQVANSLSQPHYLPCRQTERARIDDLRGKISSVRTIGLSVPLSKRGLRAAIDP